MLRQRVITAVIIAPIALACVFLLPHFEFSIFVGAVLTVAAWEWANFGGVKNFVRYIYAFVIAGLFVGVWFVPILPVLMVSMIWWLLAFIFVLQYPRLRNVWGQQLIVLAIGLVVLCPGFVALVELKRFPDSSFLICLFFFLIWGADIGAYFAGKAFGKRKLAPRVSPGKSWAGFFGGLIAAVVIAVAMSLWWGKPVLTEPNGMLFLLACAFIAVISVLGDLTISMFKRHRDIKDSSNLLPGHGGFLDRIDSGSCDPGCMELDADGTSRVL